MVAKSTHLSLAAAFTRSTSSIVTPPPVISAVATSDPVSSPCRPAVISIRSRSAFASTRVTSAAVPRHSTSSAPAARRAPRSVPSPVVEEADYIPYEDAVSSDGEVPRCDDMHQQMADMRRGWPRCTTWCTLWVRPPPSRSLALRQPQHSRSLDLRLCVSSYQALITLY